MGSTTFDQRVLGSCDFVDVLEEAVLKRHSVQVRLRDGQEFVDTLVDVVTEAGANFAVFRGHDRVPVADIRDLTQKA